MYLFVTGSHYPAFRIPSTEIIDLCRYTWALVGSACPGQGAGVACGVRDGNAVPVLA